MRVLGTFLLLVALAGCDGTAPDTVAPAPTTASPTRAAPTTPPVPKGSPLPVKVTKTVVDYPSAAEVDSWLPPTGGSDSAAEQILRHLRWEALLQARVEAPTSARCPRLSTAPGAESSCTVYYQGLPVPFTVVIDDERTSGPLFRYRSYQERFVVRADVIRSEMWRWWGSDGVPTRCDRLPAVQVLPAGVTRLRCQHLEGGAWVTKPVTVEEGGAVSVL
jgi:hypothetical protein